MKVVNLKTGDLHEVIRYVKSQSDSAEYVWCNGWFGKHVIGKDCAFVISYQLNTTQSFQENESVIPPVSGMLPSGEELQKVVERIAYEQHGEDQADDCYAKMGMLHEFVKTYVNGGNDC